MKLYLNDVGILSGILYGNNIRAVLDDMHYINLGSVHESVMVSELIGTSCSIMTIAVRAKWTT